MTNDRTAASSAPPKRGKGAIITGAVLLLIGVVVTFLGVAVPAGTAKEISATQLTAPKTAPAEWTTDLAAATTYGVYEEKGTTKVPVSDVSVTAADGTTLAVKASDAAEVKGEGGQTFTEVANFTIGTSGSFTIKVATEGAVVAVAPSVATEAKGFAWIVGVVVGPLLGLVGLIVLIVGFVQRSKSS
jgi:hypothetical protein